MLVNEGAFDKDADQASSSKINRFQLSALRPKTFVNNLKSIDLFTLGFGSSNTLTKGGKADIANSKTNSRDDLALNIPAPGEGKRSPNLSNQSPSNTPKSPARNKILDIFLKNTLFVRREELNNRLSTVATVEERKLIKQEWMIAETTSANRMREKISMDDFEVIQTLGHGGFGVVRLVRQKSTGDIYAMKSLRKRDMLRRKQEAHVRAERDLLSQASQVAECIVRLICTFQDIDFLYFVLEYMPGGDLLGLLIKLDIFPEDFTKHYAAEMVLAIEEVHKLG